MTNYAKNKKSQNRIALLALLENTLIFGFLHEPYPSNVNPIVAIKTEATS